LQTFLENNVPKSSKKQKVLLGVADPKIGAAVSDELKILSRLGGVALTKYTIPLFVKV
jgi:nucleolar protein 56